MGKQSNKKKTARLLRVMDRVRYPEDEENLVRQFEVYDALYAWCRLQAAKSQ